MISSRTPVAARLRHLRPLLLRVAGACLAARLLFLLLPGLFSIWQLRASDALFTLRYAVRGCPPGAVSPWVVHLDEDDRSRRAIDQEQLPGDYHERVIDLLTEIDVGAVIFDQIILQSHRREGAAALVRATEASGRVYYPVAARLELGSGAPPASAGSAGLGARAAGGEGAVPTSELAFLDRHLWHPQVTRPGKPLSALPELATSRRLAAVCRGLGSIACRPDVDGVYRRFPLLVRYRDGFLPGLSLRAVCDYLAVDPATIRVAFGRYLLLPDARFPDGRVQDVRIPIDHEGQVIVNFVAPWDAEELEQAHFTLGGVLAAEGAPARLEAYRDAFEETLVLFSDVTTGSRDTGPVPIDSVYYLSGIHWSIINSVLTGRFLREMPAWGGVLIDLVWVLLIAIAGAHFRVRGFVLSWLLAFGGLLALIVGLFLGPGLIMNGVRPAMGMLFAFSVVLVCNYIGEERKRTLLRERFGNYLAPSVLAKILAAPGCLDAAEKKRVTVLFSDIVGFTPWSADKSASEIRRILNAYFDEMAEAVFAQEGTIDKFMGDGLMVFFNDPVPQPDHVQRAVCAAIDMQRRARRLDAAWSAEGGPALQIRIGIHTGEAVVGNMGSSRRFDYTAVGADVNLAQRLETQATPGGILVSGAVRSAVGAETVMTPRPGGVRVKGLDAPIEAYEVGLA